MKLTFEYENNTYQIELTSEQEECYNQYKCAKADVLISDNRYIHIEWTFNNDYELQCVKVLGSVRRLNIPKIIDESELKYLELLDEYGLEDDTKSRQLWDKCYELDRAYGDVNAQVEYFRHLVELIKN